MKRIRWLMVLGMVLAGCGVFSQRAAAPAPTMVAPLAIEGYRATGGEQPPFESNKAASQASAPPVVERLVIQNVNLSIVVKDVPESVKAIQNMAKEMNGYVVSVNVYQTLVREGIKAPQANMVIRVPAERLDEALERIKQDAVEVQSETRSGEDVTDQYVDLQSRLRAKQAAEAQLLKIMEKAEKTEDVLAVYQQLQQVQSEIEVLKGQIKYYEQSAALSAITVNLLAEETIQPIEIGGWKPQGVARDAIQQLIYFLQGFVNFLIRFFLYFLPVLVLVGAALYVAFLCVRWLYRKVRKPKVTSPPAGEGKA